MSLQSKKLYEFGRYCLDPQKRQLWRDGETVPLTAKATEILLALLDHAGEVVSKNELMEAVWPDSYVEEANLARHVFLLRKALGEGAEERNLIATVPGTGYRFAGDVRQIPAGSGASQPPAAASPAPNSVLPASAAVPQARPRVWRRWSLLAVLMLLLVCFGAYLGWPLLHPSHHPERRRIVLAVLPFTNFTGDPSQEYFSDGLTEEMITELGSFDPERLGVIARTSVMHYKNSHEQLPTIARELGVDYVLEGSVRRESGTVRITAQLIQTSDQTHIWAREYNRELTSLLALQSEIAQEIGEEIHTVLGNTKQKTSLQPSLSAPDYQAYDLYLKGQYLFRKRTIPDLRKAIDYFEQATAKDPSYARAYAALADCYALLAGYSGVPQTELVAKARTAALRALQLDEHLAEAHTALALIVQNRDWDWQTAEKEFRRAIELNPNYATAHHWYAEHLMWRGRFEQAFEEAETARRLDPLSMIIAADTGVILYYSRQYERAIRQFRGVLDVDPNLPRAHMITYVYVQEGMFPQAFADLERQRGSTQNPWYWAELAYAQGRRGHTIDAQRAVTTLQRLNQRQRVDPAVFVPAYIGLGDNQQAMAWLERAYIQHSNIITALKVDPVYDPLRPDPRFRELLLRVGLSE